VSETWRAPAGISGCPERRSTSGASDTKSTDTGLADRARAPHRSPRATPAEVVSKILYLRQHYHFGPGKIADYLKQFHGLSVACATVHRILRRHSLNRLPANQKYRRHAASLDALREGAAGASAASSTSSFLSGSPAPAGGSTNSRRSTIAPAFAC
jgi:hypothetical protein